MSGCISPQTACRPTPHRVEFWGYNDYTTKCIFLNRNVRSRHVVAEVWFPSRWFAWRLVDHDSHVPRGLLHHKVFFSLPPCKKKQHLYNFTRSNADIIIWFPKFLTDPFPPSCIDSSIFMKSCAIADCIWTQQVVAFPKKNVDLTRWREKNQLLFLLRGDADPPPIKAPITNRMSFVRNGIWRDKRENGCCDPTLRTRMCFTYAWEIIPVGSMNELIWNQQVALT